MSDAKKIPAAKKPRLTLESVADRAASPPTPRWLVDGVVVQNQPAVIGGALKTLKTSVALDLAVSLATATPFLNTFAVPKPRRVAVFNGEGAEATVDETIRRILRSKRESPDDCPLHLGFRLPRLASPADRNELRRLLKGEGIEVVVIDPLYLCLLAGGRAVSAINLADVGAVLGAVADACAGVGASPVLVHHTTKGSSHRSHTATLTDLSLAGVGEFARQWMLLTRVGGYQPGTGRHNLALAVGGAAGHSSRWQVRIDEGPAGAKQREWDVEVTPGHHQGRASGRGTLLLGECV